MYLSSVYHWFQSALTPEVCGKIIDLGLKKMKEMEKQHGESITDGDMNNTQKGSSDKRKIPMGDMSFDEMEKKGIKKKDVYTRDSKVSWLTDMWIYELLQPYLLEANEKAGWNWNVDFCQPLQFTTYGVNQFCGWHADANDLPYEMFNPDVHEVLKNSKGKPILDANGRKQPKDRSMVVTDKNHVGKIRKISMTCNLSNPEDYEGGDFRFDLGPHAGEGQYVNCTEIKPQGSIIVFPSHLYHQVTPVTRGMRYSLVMWAIGLPFR